MKLPNKVTPYRQSIIPKMITICKLVRSKDYEVSELYSRAKRSMTLFDFIDSLDCLFIVGKVEMKGGKITYVA